MVSVLGTVEARRENTLTWETLATPLATPIQRIPAVPAVSSSERNSLTSTPAVPAVSSGSVHHLAKVRVAGSNPVVRSIRYGIVRCVSDLPLPA
jgi:hypothetical protein